MKRALLSTWYRLYILLGIIFGIFGFGRLTSAHEVYVLSSGRIAIDLHADSPNPIEALTDPHSLHVFLIVFVLFLLLVFLMLWASYNKRFTGFLRSFIVSIKKYAFTIARIFVGVSLLFSATHLGLFGPELPFSGFTQYISQFQLVLYVLGILFIFGIFTRFAALVSIGIYIYACTRAGFYMLNYFNYFAEFVLLLISGAGVFSADNLYEDYFDPDWSAEFEKNYGGAILRIGFGIALLFAAIYVKFIHSDLSLDVVSQYDLVRYFPFTPLMIVFGAGCVETGIALFYLFGFEIRFNTLFFLGFVTVSLFFFGEAVWPHIVLYGIAIAIFGAGYDRFSVMDYIRKRLKRTDEPVF